MGREFFMCECISYTNANHKCCSTNARAALTLPHIRTKKGLWNHNSISEFQPTPSGTESQTISLLQLTVWSCETRERLETSEVKSPGSTSSSRVQFPDWTSTSLHTHTKRTLGLKLSHLPRFPNIQNKRQQNSSVSMKSSKPPQQISSSPKHLNTGTRQKLQIFTLTLLKG